MVNPVPISFRKSPPSITSYDFTDIAAGTGYVTFDGYAIAASGALEENSPGGTPSAYSYALSSNILPYSSTIESSGSIGSGSTGLVLARSFDVQFNKPQIIKGDLFAQIPLGYANTQGNPNVNAVVIAEKLTSSGTSELARNSSEFIDDPNMAGTYGKTTLVKVNIPQTTFSNGDVLRLSVEGHSNSNEGGNPRSVQLGHDPQARDGTFIDSSSAALNIATTRLIFNVPFKVDI